MKKQINPNIKAHLLRGALYLLLLLAVCAIPFALAQRSTKRSVANPKPNANLAAAGKYVATATQVGGAHAPTHKPAAAHRELPYDLRTLPAQAPKYPYSTVRERGTS